MALSEKSTPWDHLLKIMNVLLDFMAAHPIAVEMFQAGPKWK